MGGNEFATSVHHDKGVPILRLLQKMYNIVSGYRLGYFTFDCSLQMVYTVLETKSKKFFKSVLQIVNFGSISIDTLD